MNFFYETSFPSIFLELLYLSTGFLYLLTCFEPLREVAALNHLLATCHLVLCNIILKLKTIHGRTHCNKTKKPC